MRHADVAASLQRGHEPTDTNKLGLWTKPENPSAIQFELVSLAPVDYRYDLVAELVEQPVQIAQGTRILFLPVRASVATVRGHVKRNQIVGINAPVERGHIGHRPVTVASAHKHETARIHHERVACTNPCSQVLIEFGSV